jgi:2-polyprenyl-3-methyl-5-hydroxy-6-metoxy-1,4-benzoquinol methylase
MPLYLNVDLTEEQKKEMASIPASSWFINVKYNNAESPNHPIRKIEENYKMKQTLVNDWIKNSVKGKTVLDLFSANGAFSFIAAFSGAKKVVGLEFSKERIRCAEFIKSTIDTKCEIIFMHGDVYNITQYFNNQFDVVLCFGGLYHIADPPLILKNIRKLTKSNLILQTAQVLPYPFNFARFIVRRKDMTKNGLTSIREGYGTWHCSPKCLREIILHGGFKIIEEKRPPLLKRNCYPWYSALCEPI